MAALAVTAAGVAALTLPAAGGAGRTPTIGRLRSQDANLAAKARSAVLDLYALDSHLTSTRSRLGALDTQAARLESERSSIRRQLRLAALDSRLSQQRVALRLRYLYDYGLETSSLDVLLGSTSIEQALTRLDDVSAVAQANETVIIQLRTAEGRLADLSRRLAERQLLLTETVSALSATAASLGQAQAQRTTYIAQLESRRAYDGAEISRLNAAAQTAERRSEQLAQARARAAAASAATIRGAAVAAPVLAATPVPQSGALATVLTAPAPSQTPVPAAGPAVAPSAGGHSITVVATGYALRGRTSTGIPVGYGVAAVDPSVIPLGTRMTIPGYGEAVAADTGGAISGATIDLWFPSAAQADAWGRRVVTVVVGG